jgi:hypothetical protein
MATYLGRFRHADAIQATRWNGSEAEGRPQMHVFHKDAFEWSVGRDGHLHVRSRGSMDDEAGEMAEAALGIASTEGRHDPLAEHPRERDEGERKPWLTKGSAPRPPFGRGHAGDGSCRGLNEFFRDWYARH